MNDYAADVAEMERMKREGTWTPDKGRYWYFISYYECPACGGGKEYRERRYTPRPEDWKDRHEFVEAWDYCGI